MATPTTPNTTWVDGSGGGTPISAARLNVAEARIAEALAGFEYAYNQFTAGVSITATTEATATTVVTASAVTFDGATIVMIEFSTPLVIVPANAGGNFVVLVLYEDGVSIGKFGETGDLANAYVELPFRLARRHTPAAGSRTYSVRGYRTNANGTVTGGTGGSGAFVPGYIRITKA